MFFFYCLATKHIPELKFFNASNGGTQCFPFYVYNTDGTNRRENFTDDALASFCSYYKETVSKKNVFDYIYALLHHAEYRTRYQENLKRELPRIPLVDSIETFHALSVAGSDLIKLHTGYEAVAEYLLTDEYNQQATLTDIFHINKMRLNKEKTAIIVNSHLTLSGIPPEAHEYKLGGRSALEWVLDQYRIKEKVIQTARMIRNT